MSRRPLGGARRRRSQPRKVGGLLDTVLGDLGLEAAARAFRVAEVWAQAVGADVAAHASPVGMRGSVLEVSADSSVWCQHLQLGKAQLLESLRDVLGDEAPDDIRFRTG